MSQTKLVVGCGYLGSRVAQAWRDAGHRTLVTTRSPERMRDFERQGFEPLLVDVTDSSTLSQLPQVDTVLYAVGFDRSSKATRSQVYVDGLQAMLEALPRVTDRLIFISSTGVYGQTQGEWVNEGSPCLPTREGGICCLAAEETLSQSAWGPRSVVLRLAGIYGPGRIPFLERLREGQPLPVDPDGHLNLIHVQDAARAVLAAEVARLPHLYLVSDGHPVRRRRYYEEVASHVGVTPQFAPVDPQSPRAQRRGSDKRIRIDALLRDLPWTPEFPDYRAGLAQILSGESPA